MEDVMNAASARSHPRPVALQTGAATPSKARIVLPGLVGLVIAGLFMVLAGLNLLPLFWGVLTSLKSQPDLFRAPPVLFDFVPTAENYQRVVDSGFLGNIRISVFYCVVTVAGVLVLALPAAYAFDRFDFPLRRALFMLACGVVPILANGVRAWGTIYVAQSRGVAFAAGFDHIVYGWIFFAIVMSAMLGLAWRFSDRPADDRVVDAGALEASPLLNRLAGHGIGGWTALAAMLLATATAAAWGVALAQPLADALLAAAGLRP